MNSRLIEKIDTRDSIFVIEILRFKLWRLVTIDKQFQTNPIT